MGMQHMYLENNSLHSLKLVDELNALDRQQKQAIRVK